MALRNVKKCGAADGKGLMQLRAFLEDSSKSNSYRCLTGATIKDISSVASACAAQEKPDNETLGLILDILVYIAHCNDNDGIWSRCDHEFGNLLLKTLAAIERSDKFQMFFCKLLTSTSLICSHSASAWRQVVRPLLNVFINKNFDFVYLERAVKEFKKISRCGDNAETLSFVKQNIHLLKGFSFLAQRVGDIITQMDIVELVFLYIAEDRELAKGFFATGNRDVENLVKNLDFVNLERDFRLFLNTLNKSLGPKKRIFSINCNIIYFGNVALMAPAGMDGIWVDVNNDSKRISICCSDFISNDNECVILQVPLDEVEELKVEFGTISGDECHCITLTIGKLTEMYRFAKGRTLICTALNAKNPQNVINDFIRATEELSGKARVTEGKDRPSSHDSLPNAPRTQKSTFPRNRFSCTSPVTFRTVGINEDGGQSPERLTEVPEASPRSPGKEEKTYAEPKSQRKYGETGKKSAVIGSGGNLQVHQISSSGLDGQKRSASLSLNSSLSSCMSPRRVQDESSVLRSVENGPGKVKAPAAREKLSKPSRDAGGIRSPAVEKTTADDHCRQSYSRQIYEEWASSCEDHISTQEFAPPDRSKENVEPKRELKKIPVWGGAEKRVTKPRRSDWLSRNKRMAKQRKQVETVNTSLLDPNGYSYMRWKMPTTSERSNFWLNKLKETEKKTVHAKCDVFNFAEDELSDDWNVFKERAEKKSGKPADKRNSTQTNTKSARPARKKVSNERRSALKEVAPRTLSETFKNAKRTRPKPTKTKAPVNRSSSPLPSPNKVSGTASESKPETWKNKVNTPTEKRKVIVGGDESSSAALPRKKTKLKTARATRQAMDAQLDEIERVISTEMDDFIRERRKHEMDKIAGYLKDAEEKLARVAGQSDEYRARAKRFEKLVEYFTEGCSRSDLISETRKEIARIKQDLEAMKGSGDHKKAEGKVDRFIKRLKEMIMKDAETKLDKQLKELKIQFLERYLSNYRK